MKTIYLTEQGSQIHKEKQRLVVKRVNHEPTLLLTKELKRIILFGNIQLTTPAIATCLQFQILVLFLSQTGKYKGHLWSVSSTNLSVEKRQYLQQENTNFQLNIAKSVILGKLTNSRQLLLRLNRQRKQTEIARAIAKLDLTLKSVVAAEHLDSLRGYEGIGTAQYYAVFDLLITNSEFSFNKRSRRPPANPFNSLLSFGYTLLFNNVFSLVIAEQLSPYLGHLHYGERQAPYLVFDLIEEFRSPIVDSLVLKIIDRRLLKPDDFQMGRDGRGFYLTNAARQKFIHHFEGRMNEKVTHPDVQHPVTYRRAVQLQIKRYKKGLFDAECYQPFLRAR